ncbi:hypothetical protein BaRGS_00031625 [Batillaria attramentaria]|uniref:Major facilitator superfamily (MFS) profile domain-containing protein n=1 Tax=Batillaria attramentaria TaxID=370345 RepID=A0ABD0JQ70_9CAEN
MEIKATGGDSASSLSDIVLDTKIGEDDIEGIGRVQNGKAPRRPKERKTTEGSKRCGCRVPTIRAAPILVACVLVQLTLGVVYTFGNFMPYLTSYLRNVTGETSLDYSQSLWIDNSNWMVGAATMPVVGLVEGHIPRRLFLFIGFIFFAMSLFGSYWAVQKSFLATVFVYGALQGVGQATLWPGSYNLALAWFPDRKGFVGGLAMAGYGAGAFAWNQIVTNWINPDNLQPDLQINEDMYFTQPEVLDKVPSCFLLLGGVLSGVLCLSLAFLYDPPPSVSGGAEVVVPLRSASPERASPVSQTEPHMVEIDFPSSTQHCEKVLENKAGTAASLYSGCAEPVEALRTDADCDDTDDQSPVYTPKEILRSRAAWTTWLFNFSTDISFVFVVDFYKTYGQTFIHDDRLLSLIGSFASLSNALGRLVLGLLADRFGLMPCMLTSQGVLTVAAVAILACDHVGASMFFIVVIVVFLAYGGVYSLQSLIVFTMFGPRYFTFSYGFISTTPLLSYLFPVFVASAAKDVLGWHGVFLAGAVCVFVGWMLNASLLLDCGHPIPNHMKRDLFKRNCAHPRPANCLCGR